MSSIITISFLIPVVFSFGFSIDEMKFKIQVFKFKNGKKRKEAEKNN